MLAHSFPPQIPRWGLRATQLCFLATQEALLKDLKAGLSLVMMCHTPWYWMMLDV